MNDPAASSFVRQELVPERRAPLMVTGFVGLLRTRLFNSPTNILLTILGVLLLWFTIVPTVKFLLIDAVWSGTDRTACLAEKAGHPVGACWPFVQAKFSQFIYGFYPEAQRWRVNLTFLLAALLLLPLLIPRLPAKGLNAGLFFIAFPIVAFFLLQVGKTTPQTPFYLWLNLIGALAVMVSLFKFWNLSSFVIECFWAGISAYGLFKGKRTKV